MRGKDLLKDITNIDDEIIREAATSGRIKKKSVWIKWGAIAASLVLILLTTLNSGRIYNFLKGRDINIENNKNYGVYIPPIQLPESSVSDEGESGIMLGLIVYKGKVYIQDDLYNGEAAIAVNRLTGEDLGYAYGHIDGWSNQDEFSKEFASTVVGEVYSVNGYSTDFRLCVKADYFIGGELTECVAFFQNLNGISLNTGTDLFGDKLRISDNWNDVKYQKDDNWNSLDPYIYNDLSGITKNDINSFLNELFCSKFVDISRTDQYRSAPRHLIFYMNDGTRVELRLFEGGYVGYQPLDWECVKMPGKIFDLLFNACQ